MPDVAVHVQDGAGFSATGLTISGMALEGVRINTNSWVTLLSTLASRTRVSASTPPPPRTGTISGADVTNSGTNASKLDVATIEQRSPCLRIRSNRGRQRHLLRHSGLGHLF